MEEKNIISGIFSLLNLAAILAFVWVGYDQRQSFQEFKTLWHESQMYKIKQIDAMLSYSTDLPAYKIPAMATQIYHSCEVENIDPKIVCALLEYESAGDTKAESCKGAYGMLQLMGGTAQDMCDSLNLKYDREDQLQNADLGIKYLAKCYRKSQGNIDSTICRYNAGLNSKNLNNQESTDLARKVRLRVK
jgi:hypothetical protein